MHAPASSGVPASRLQLAPARQLFSGPTGTLPHMHWVWTLGSTHGWQVPAMHWSLLLQQMPPPGVHG
jgi:hypothetical protein